MPALKKCLPPPRFHPPPPLHPYHKKGLLECLARTLIQHCALVIRPFNDI